MTDRIVPVNEGEYQNAGDVEVPELEGNKEKDEGEFPPSIILSHSSHASEYSEYLSLLQKRPRALLLASFGLLILLAVYGFTIFPSLTNGGYRPPNAESTVTDRYFSRFDNITQSTDFAVLMESKEWTVEDPEFRQAYEDLKAELVRKFPLTNFASYFDYDYLTSMTSTDKHKALATAELPKKIVDYTGVPPYTYDDFKKAGSGIPLKLTFSGEYLTSVESGEMLFNSLMQTETFAAPVLIFLLIIAFDGVVAILLPLLLILWDVIISFAVLHVLTFGFHVSTYVTDVTLIFGAGLAIDFSLFMHLRFTEETKKREANPNITIGHCIDTMIKTSGRTVAFSALLLTATLVGALQFHEYYLTTMALAIIIPAIAAAVGSITFIPLLYLVLGDYIFYGSLKPIKQYLATKLFSHTEEEEGKNAKSDLSTAKQETKTYQKINEDIENQDQVIEFSKDTRIEEADNNKQIILGNDQPEVLAEPVDLLQSKEHENDYLFHFVVFVMKYPWPFIIIIVGGLVGLLYVFVSQVKLANQSYGGFPLDSPTRYFYETMEKDFTTNNNNGNVFGTMTIYLETTDKNGIQSKQFIETLYNFCENLPSQTKNIKSVTSITTIRSNFTLSDYLDYYSDPFNKTHTNFTKALISPIHLTDFHSVTVIQVSSTILPSDERLGETVRSVRKFTSETFGHLQLDQTAIASESSSISLTGSNEKSSLLIRRYGVGGGLASEYDLNRDIVTILPDCIAVILLSMYFLIILLTGSIVLPLKAIACAGLSICASFGFLVLVIQDGRGEKFLQFHNNFRCLDQLQLIFIFVVAFGLSLDYEVFLLGRIQEIYQKTMNNTFAVAQGISTSGSTITLAAALLCTAIGGFIASDILVLKQIGMGIGLTIILDATLVRCVLVPALMAVMGDWNWWAPSPVRAVVKYFDIQH